MGPSMSTTSAQVRAALGHPVIDSDGHVIEYMPAVLPFIRDALGAAAFERYRSTTMPVEQSIGGAAGTAARRQTRSPQSAWWASPAKNTLDLATAVLPELLHDRLDEMGIDFAVLFPTKALGTARLVDPEIRRGVCRGFNDFYAATYRPFADRLAVAGIIPMDDPQEAIAELRHCHEIGLKVVAIPEGVWRPIPARSDASVWLAPGQTHWFDNFGLDSEYDYDPVWSTFVELGYPLMSHGGLGHVAPNQYLSITNYSANHIGSFRDKMYQLCKSLYFAGVTRRFPALNLGFLECGVAWASTLLADICEHWEKRNVDALRDLDPRSIDYQLLERLFHERGSGFAAASEDLGASLRALPAVGVPPDDHDDWRFLQVDRESELVELFAPRMFFGCEADDRTVAFAFSPANPKGCTMQPVFSSDIAHWDVPDMAAVVAESWELVTKGLIDEAAYRAFVFDNPVKLFGRAFFAGTAIEHAVAAVSAR
jgi:predicted TIM-barrel fold metal-dependent hydrolase